jgi:stage II sporulation protein D
MRLRATRTAVALAIAAGALASCRPGERLAGSAPTPTAPSAPRPAANVPAAAGAASNPRPSSAAALPNTLPDVRIGISLDTSVVRISAPVEYDIRAVNGKALAHATMRDTLRITSDADGRITARAGSRTIVDAAPAPLRIVPMDLPFVTIDGRMYRGEVLLVTPHGGRVTAINVTDMESYLLGVVPREMGKRPATEIEALKAQAVAARTYAIGNMGGHSDQGFDFYATVLDQVYGGTADEDSVVTRAVMETRGQIITYDGKPILAYYASTCGGTTAAIEESWPSRAPLPYLRSRSDRVPGTDDDYYCKSSSRFTWKTEWTRAQLLAVLSTTLRAHTRGAVKSVRSIDDVAIVSKGPSGRATVDLTADGRTYRLRADSVRWVMRPTPTGGILNSSRLYAVDASKDTDGHVDHLAIEGGGWGHAIGMCQVGAMARARAGQSFREILGAYYTGVSIESLYR